MGRGFLFARIGSCLCLLAVLGAHALTTSAFAEAPRIPRRPPGRGGAVNPSSPPLSSFDAAKQAGTCPGCGHALPAGSGILSGGDGRPSGLPGSYSGLISFDRCLTPGCGMASTPGSPLRPFADPKLTTQVTGNDNEFEFEVTPLPEQATEIPLSPEKRTSLFLIAGSSKKGSEALVNFQARLTERGGSQNTARVEGLSSTLEAIKSYVEKTGNPEIEELTIAGWGRGGRVLLNGPTSSPTDTLAAGSVGLRTLLQSLKQSGIRIKTLRLLGNRFADGYIGQPHLMKEFAYHQEDTTVIGYTNPVFFGAKKGDVPARVTGGDLVKIFRKKNRIPKN